MRSMYQFSPITAEAFRNTGLPESYETLGSSDYVGSHRKSDVSGFTCSSDVSAVSGSDTFSGLAWSCMACGDKPAESRNESVFVLCYGCCDSLRIAYMAELGTIEAVHAKMSEVFGYAMVDAVLDEMFD